MQGDAGYRHGLLRQIDPRGIDAEFLQFGQRRRLAGGGQFQPGELELRVVNLDRSGRLVAAELIAGGRGDGALRLGQGHAILDEAPQRRHLQPFDGDRAGRPDRIKRDIALPAQETVAGQGGIHLVETVPPGQGGYVVELEIEVIGAVPDGGFLGLVFEQYLAIGQHDLLQHHAGRRGVLVRFGLIRVLGRQTGGNPGEVQHPIPVLNQVDAGRLQTDLGKSRRPVDQGAQQFKVDIKPVQTEYRLTVGFGERGVLEVQAEQERIERNLAQGQWPLDQFRHLLRRE